VISTPFNASALTPSLLTTLAVDSGFGVFEMLCVLTGSAVVGVAFALHADRMMDVINNNEKSFFILKLS